MSDERGARFLRADDALKELKPYHGPFDAVAFNAHLCDRGEARRTALTRATMALKPGGRMVISERKAGDAEGSDVDGGLDFAEIVRDLPLARVDASGSCSGKDLSAAATATVHLPTTARPRR